MRLSFCGNKDALILRKETICWV